MKRWLYYIVIVIVVAALSGNTSAGSDVGKLQPVQVVRVTRQDGAVVLETDTADRGVGARLSSALADMKRAASAEIFLDTADHLVVSPECEGLIPELMAYLRPSCAVCVGEGEVDMEQVGAFLEIHKPEVTLMRYRAGETDLPILVAREGRMELVS